jgi:hypothetical protein
MTNMRSNGQARVGTGGWSKTFGLIVLAVLSVVLVQWALLYGPADNQIVRIGLWLGVLVCVCMTLSFFVEAMRSYQVHFLLLPSTWLMLLALALAVGFLFAHRTVNDGELFSNWTDLFSNLTNLEVALLAGVMLCSFVSVIVNIAKTNLIFGIVLSALQLTFSVLLIVVIAWFVLPKDSKET